MSNIKGYPSSEKLDNTRQEFATVSPVGQRGHALDVRGTISYTNAGGDAAEAGSTTQVIEATGHAATKGDVISWTTGALAGQEYAVTDTATDSITVGALMPSAPGVGDAFNILRPKILQVSSSGGVETGPIKFTRDGADQEVTEDTGTPANNRPLPVKLTDFSGDMVLNSSNLHLEVQLDHDSANPDSIQIGDGTDTLAINADGSTNITDNGGSLTVDDGGVSLTTDTPQLPATLGTKTAAGSNSVTLASDHADVPTQAKGRSSVDLIRHSYDTVGVTTAAYTELVASTSGTIEKLRIFDSSGEIMILATGAAASETDVLYIEPGGPGDIELSIPSGTRLSVKALSANATTGDLVINGFS